MTSVRALPTWRPVTGRIIGTALIVAALDFFYVLVRWVWLAHALTVQELAQSIATGLLGRGAYDGGVATAVLGLALHLVIASGWTVIFFVLTARVPRLRRLISTTRGRALAGLAWGPVIWLMMDFVVLPLSQARPTPTSSPTFYINLLQHALMIGLPMALLLGGER